MKYRRANGAGGTCLFTVSLADRHADTLLRHVGYTHFNPVKHGWVSRPVDRAYSTSHRNIACGLVTELWGGGEENGRSVYGEP